MNFEPPENIGDIYRVYGYSGCPYYYGVIYMDACPDDPGQWCWWIHMQDRDQYHWHSKKGEPPTVEALQDEMWVDSIELVRRNPLPNSYHEMAYELLGLQDQTDGR